MANVHIYKMNQDGEILYEFATPSNTPYPYSVDVDNQGFLWHLAAIE